METGIIITRCALFRVDQNTLVLQELHRNNDGCTELFEKINIEPPIADPVQWYPWWKGSNTAMLLNSPLEHFKVASVPFDLGDATKNALLSSITLFATPT